LVVVNFLFLPKSRYEFLILVIINLCDNDFVMKPSLVADEMFPEGAGPYMDIDEVK